MLRSLLTIACCFTVFAQAPTIGATNAERANQGTVAIVAGSYGSTNVQIASELAAVLDEGDVLRVLPIVGQGSAQNLRDILFLRGVDMAIAPMDVLEQFRAGRPGIERQIHFVTRLFNEEVHVVTRRGINRLEDLQGRQVNFISRNNGAFVTGSRMFDAYRIQVRPVFYDLPLALEKVRNGDIAAAVLVTAKPAQALLSIRPDDGLQLLQVGFPNTLINDYAPGTLTAEDYPGLVPPDVNISTFSVSTALMVYNFRDKFRAAKVDRFIVSFLSQFAAFHEGARHPKWRDVNLAGRLEGWTRAKAAENWLTQQNQIAGKAPTRSLRRQFELFLASEGERVVQQYLSGAARRPGGLEDLTAEEREALYADFIRWQRGNQQ